MTTVEQNIEMVRKYFEAWNKNDKDLFNEVLDEFYDDYHHNEVGRAHVVDFVDMLHRALADLRFEIDDIFGDGDRVCVRLTTYGSGTEHGKLFGVPTAGKKVVYPGIHIYEMRDGLVHGHWAALDDLGLMQQIGLIPKQMGPPAGAPGGPPPGVPQPA
jgi:steroid delta-isomerase-like uncharacterized protein